jgi:hypothetical protein
MKLTISQERTGFHKERKRSKKKEINYYRMDVKRRGEDR